MTREPGVATVAAGEGISFAEEVFWQAERDGAAAAPFVECPRHLPILLRIRGRIDEAALAGAIAAIVARHAPLRSSFRETSSGLVRAVRPADGMPTLEIVEAVDPDRVTAMLLDDVRAPFDLESGPLVRAKLLRLTDGSAVLAVVVHHIVFDGWSVRVFLKELGAFYETLAAGATPAVPEPGATYADYVARQRALLEAPDARGSLAFWEERLRGARAPALPSRTALATHLSPSDAIRFTIDADRTARLRRFAASQRITPAVLLATLFARLLRRWTGSADVVFGMPVVDRPMGRFDDLIGLFLNLVVLRIDLEGTAGVAEALGRAQAAFRGAYQHGHVPYALVRRRTPHADTLARVVLNVLNFQRLDPSLPGLDVEPLSIDAGLPSHADLSLHLSEAAGGIGGRLIYKPDLFTAAMLRELTDEFDREVASALAGGGAEAR